jgi:hypothetical protein
VKALRSGSSAGVGSVAKPEYTLHHSHAASGTVMPTSEQTAFVIVTVLIVPDPSSVAGSPPSAGIAAIVARQVC